VVSAIVKFRHDKSPLLTSVRCSIAQFDIMAYVSKWSFTLRSYFCWISQIEALKSDQVSRLYFTAVVFLHVACKTTVGPLTDEMSDVLVAACLHLNNARGYLNARHSSVLLLSQAATLMKVIANSSRSTVQLVEIELAKEYLYRALRCNDTGSSSNYCLANVYLAVLYYTTGLNQTAIDHCALVTKSQHHSQCSSHVVQGTILLRIDDQVDNILGLAVFYQYIQAAALNKDHAVRHVSIFTTELFAHYLHIKLLSITKCH